ncbi:unnamed protein product [Phytophthora fragariaefolia]|uniref:Unnamed protein product n=1 Tax=Phytophthora fragariaefolia TaxID=1490495 RepID=A0A9W6YG77_9STRA|nr:unnamed protein product [Phytophthora fragariaefolia]
MILIWAVRILSQNNHRIFSQSASSGYRPPRFVCRSSMVTPVLEPEADDLATVAEALALIDAYDGSTSGSDSTGTPVPENSSFNFEGGVEEQPKPQRKRKSRNPAGYSTQLLHRKKAEMQQLREEALLLEAKVKQLKRTRVVGVGALEAHASQLKEKARFRWMELAAIELKKRQKSESTNRKLRALMANQAKVDHALRGVIMKESVLEVGSCGRVEAGDELTAVSGPCRGWSFCSRSHRRRGVFWLLWIIVR